MIEEKNLKIKTIKNGTVIDHITHGKALGVLRILGIGEGSGYTLTLAMNIPSRVLGRKDIVKVEDRDLDPAEINKIAIIAPKATINKIRDHKVVEKNKVALPSEIIGTLRCSNPACVTNKAREPVVTDFMVKCVDPLVLICKYCEREISVKDLM